MFAELLNKVKKDVINDVKVFFPAKVIKFYHQTQRIDVEIVFDGFGNVYNIPVMQPLGIYVPYKAGQNVLVAVFQDDISAFFKEENPEKKSNRKFQLRDAMVIGFLHTDKTKSLQENNDDFLIKYNGTDIKLKPNGVVEINANSLTANVAGALIIDKTKSITITNSDTVSLKSSKTTIESELLITGKTSITGDVSIKGATVVDGNTNLKGTLIVDNNTELKGTLKVVGNTELGGTLTVSGNTTINSSVTISGSLDVSSNITAGGATIGGVNFSSHTHSYTYIIPTQGGSPTTGNTLPPT
jgi:cytoskeletal protein CcmA (bactofilin family)